MCIQNKWWRRAAIQKSQSRVSGLNIFQRESSPQDQTDLLVPCDEMHRNEFLSLFCGLFSFLSSVWTQRQFIWNVSVCHIQPPVHIQASCALRQLCDYTGQAILAVCQAVDCERREEEICSRADLLQLSVSVDFCGSCSFTRSFWSLCALQESNQSF